MWEEMHDFDKHDKEEPMRFDAPRGCNHFE